MTLREATKKAVRYKGLESHDVKRWRMMSGLLNASKSSPRYSFSPSLQFSLGSCFVSLCHRSWNLRGTKKIQTDYKSRTLFNIKKNLKANK